MTKRDWTHRLTKLAAAGLIGLAVAAGAGTGARANEEDSDEAFDTRFLRGLLGGLGLRRDGGNSIDYRERSPLVIPPARNLPAPETASAAEKTAGWPNDPDVRRAKEIKAQRKQRTKTVEDEWNPELPDRLGPRAKTVPAGQRPTGGPYHDPTAPSTQAELKSKSFLSGITSLTPFGAKEEYGTFTGEPPRTSLTEPPPGYRTPSAAQPYGVGKERGGSGPASPLDHASSNSTISR